MKTQWICNLVCMLACIISVPAWSQQAYIKEYRKSEQVSNNVVVDLDVNFSKVTLTTWDSDKIDIYVKVTANVKSQERADDMFDKVNVGFGATQSKVAFSVVTKSLVTTRNEKFNVEVDMKVPAGASLTGSFNFGDLILSDLSGPCQLLVEYSSFAANKLLSANNDLKVQFGNANIKYAGGGVFKCEYGNIELGSINNDTRCESDFGDVKISHVAPSCKNLSLDAEYGDLSVTLDAGCSFMVEAKSEYGDVDLPSTFKEQYHKSGFSDEKKSGTLGSNPTGKLLVSARFGHVVIR